MGSLGNGNSNNSPFGPPTLLPTNGQGPSSLHHMSRMMEIPTGLPFPSVSSSSPHLQSPSESPVPKLVSSGHHDNRSLGYTALGSPMKTDDGPVAHLQQGTSLGTMFGSQSGSQVIKFPYFLTMDSI
jgi:hypothetical protein